MLSEALECRSMQNMTSLARSAFNFGLHSYCLEFWSSEREVCNQAQRRFKHHLCRDWS